MEPSGGNFPGGNMPVTDISAADAWHRGRIIRRGTLRRQKKMLVSVKLDFFFFLRQKVPSGMSRFLERLNSVSGRHGISDVMMASKVVMFLKLKYVYM